MQGTKKDLSTVKEEEEFSFDNSRSSKDSDPQSKSTKPSEDEKKTISSEQDVTINFLEFRICVFLYLFTHERAMMSN